MAAGLGSEVLSDVISYMSPSALVKRAGNGSRPNIISYMPPSVLVNRSGRGSRSGSLVVMQQTAVARSHFLQ